MFDIEAVSLNKRTHDLEYVKASLTNNTEIDVKIRLKYEIKIFNNENLKIRTCLLIKSHIYSNFHIKYNDVNAI